MVGVRVVPGLGEVVVDRARVGDLIEIDAQELVRLAQAVDPLGGREDHVIAVARPQLGHHALHRVEVGLADLDAVLLLEGLDHLRFHVLGPVEVDEVAVRLGLDDLLGRLLGRLWGRAHAAAGEADSEGQAGAASEQLTSPKPLAPDISRHALLPFIAATLRPAPGNAAGRCLPSRLDRQARAGSRTHPSMRPAGARHRRHRRRRTRRSPGPRGRRPRASGASGDRAARESRASRGSRNARTHSSIHSTASPSPSAGHSSTSRASRSVALSERLELAGHAG